MLFKHQTFANLSYIPSQHSEYKTVGYYTWINLLSTTFKGFIEAEQCRFRRILERTASEKPSSRSCWPYGADGWCWNGCHTSQQSPQPSASQIQKNHRRFQQLFIPVLHRNSHQLELDYCLLAPVTSLAHNFYFNMYLGWFHTANANANANTNSIKNQWVKWKRQRF